MNQEDTNDYVKFETTNVTIDDILKCSFSNWCNLFKDNLYSYRIIKPLPESFIEYLLSDGIKLNSKNQKIDQNSDNEYSDWEDEANVETEEESKDVHSKFPELHEQIIKDIKQLGGKVIPKLNWSSPKDANWLLPGNNINCTDVNDIYLLLKSSDHIVDDLLYPFSEVEKKEIDIKVEYELILKKWIDINPALEFRIFVKDGQILGISQRDLNHYEFLKDLQTQLNEIINQFMLEAIDKLKKIDLNSFIIDIYIPRPFSKIYIIDINPFSRKSNSLLFTWNELLTKKFEKPEFRLINETNVGAFAKKQYSESQVPIDVVGATHDSEALIELAREWDKLQKQEDE
ncbi:CDC123 [Candida pseudojiufengensis]|uniref:CDC123 n=1 Tax=Candida pseudojiufengensis TaxID=497109 RepID=UPI0022258A98|nr:CDC123 [Candida pseudojiufengensis]KAI5965714.1 CDC123 [Candida pseudojiufengensis]